MPLIEKHITAAEYAAPAHDQAARLPPGKLAAVLGMISYDGGRSVIHMFISEMPVEVQPAIKDLAVKASDAYAAELYGTAAAPG